MTACLRELRCSVSPANRPLAVNSITVVLPRILLARMSGLAAPHTRSLFKGCRAIHEYANDSVRLNVAVCTVLDWPRTEMCGWRCYSKHVACTYRSLCCSVCGAVVYVRMDTCACRLCSKEKNSHCCVTYPTVQGQSLLRSSPCE